MLSNARCLKSDNRSTLALVALDASEHLGKPNPLLCELTIHAIERTVPTGLACYRDGGYLDPERETYLVLHPTPGVAVEVRLALRGEEASLT